MKTKFIFLNLLKENSGIGGTINFDEACQVYGVAVREE